VAVLCFAAGRFGWMLDVLGGCLCLLDAGIIKMKMKNEK